MPVRCRLSTFVGGGLGFVADRVASHAAEEIGASYADASVWMFKQFEQCGDSVGARFDGQKDGGGLCDAPAGHQLTAELELPRVQ